MCTKQISFRDALMTLSDYTGISLEEDKKDDETISRLRSEKDIRAYVSMSNRLSRREDELPELPEKRIKEYCSRRTDYFLKFGFLPSTLEYFQIGSKIDSEGVERATVPIRDHLGNVVSISGRRTDSDEEPRYKLDWKFPKSKILYNLNNALISGSDTIIIVEGFKACWAVYEAGFNNVAACMGSLVVPEQALVLASTGFTKCLLMLDGDGSGYNGMEKSIPLVSRLMRTVPVYLENKLSPDDFTRQDLKDLLDIYLAIF